MSYVKIWIHSVWGTKKRFPFLTNEVKNDLMQHIKENAKIKKIYIDSINGYTEHLHCLHTLNADMSISKAMQLIKGESAFWINKNKITDLKFEWADEYYAASVSESMLYKVRNYIKNQELHHRKKSYSEEVEVLIKKYGFRNYG